MADVQDSWRELAGKAEALGLKLKLHLEQEQEAGHERQPGDTKAMVEDLGRRLGDAFESMGNAAKDPAVHEDVKDLGGLFKDALMTTFSKVGAEVSSRNAPPAPSSSGADADPGSETAGDPGSGDEGDGDDA